MLLQMLLATFFISQPVTAAEACACPTIQCEPCQVRLPLGEEKKQCDSQREISCQKFVCENVDNFFQCLAGSPPLYIEREPSQRYTEPRYDANATPQPIPMTDWQYGPEQFIEEESRQAPPSKPASLRAPASVMVDLPKASFEPSALWLEVKKGHGTVQGKALKKKTRLLKSLQVKSKSGGEFNVKSDREVLRLKLSPGAEFLLVHEDDSVLIHMQKGSLSATVLKADPLFVLNVDEWRVAKQSGEIKVQVAGTAMSIDNISGELYVRQKEIIAKTERYPVGSRLTFHQGLPYTIEAIGSTPAQKFVMSPSKSKNIEARVPAGDNFCSSPAGQFEQCAWKCFGAGKDSKNCFNPKTPATCVRFTCSADAHWKLPTFVSNSSCERDTVRIGTCR